MLTSRQAAAELGATMDALRWYHRQHGYGTKLGDRLTWTEEDLLRIREHQARGPGRPSHTS
jgi:hypothetical protein